MKQLSRRHIVAGGVTGTLTIGTGVFLASAVGEEPEADELWTLEGELHVHPKFQYRYYIMLLDGQECALCAADHNRELEQFSRE